MNYAAIKPCDISNGPGCRVSLFVAGCRRHCPGCFNQEAQDFDYGKKFTKDTVGELVGMLKPDYISGLSILGGEPLEPENMLDILALIQTVRYGFPQKTIWLYTGFTLEELLERDGYDRVQTLEILRCLDILVDSPFIEAQKNISLQFRGSENQRIIDIRKARAEGKLILWDGKT